MSRVLYLSYDGLTDPLGRSQVQPYLEGLARRGHDIHIISFEKPHLLSSTGPSIRRSLQQAGIQWSPHRYTAQPPVLSTVWDLLRMRNAAFRLHAQKPFDLVHCRSYPASLIGTALKRKRGVRYVFDMRGFWPDERVDDGFWDPRHPVYGAVFRYFKRQEAEFMRAADAVVCLSEAARNEVTTWSSWATNSPPISVIPCSADMSLFAPRREDERGRLRADLGLRTDDLVVSYLGSVGRYMLDEMLACFRCIRTRHGNARMLFITPDPATTILRRAVAQGIDPGDLVITAAHREEVPALLAATDIGLFFTRPTYSKLGMSPTKLGEYLASGIPVVTNSGIGDVDATLDRVGAGFAVAAFEPTEYERAAAAIPHLLSLDPQATRERAAREFDLELACDRYAGVYHLAAGNGISEGRS
jgi:glycosyltransferase involved in cell wall biosynthesis